MSVYTFAMVLTNTWVAGTLGAFEVLKSAWRLPKPLASLRMRHWCSASVKGSSFSPCVTILILRATLTLNAPFPLHSQASHARLRKTQHSLLACCSHRRPHTCDTRTTRRGSRHRLPTRLCYRAR
ncbi:hypothetical protein BKA81DRAFT_351878 [Phyllosticta paracitricarpa]|uniref:Secreted protein n=2 Tax=Phyllosticta TaxID=121621 RepID=A0ABR1N683_9PEZI